VVATPLRHAQRHGSVLKKARISHCRLTSNIVRRFAGCCHSMLLGIGGGQDPYVASFKDSVQTETRSGLIRVIDSGSRIAEPPARDLEVVSNQVSCTQGGLGLSSIETKMSVYVDGFSYLAVI
jgi:hypothetical protein